MFVQRAAAFGAGAVMATRPTADAAVPDSPSRSVSRMDGEVWGA
jgi:hypothetical protein